MTNMPADGPGPDEPIDVSASDVPGAEEQTPRIDPRTNEPATDQPTGFPPPVAGYPPPGQGFGPTAPGPGSGPTGPANLGASGYATRFGLVRPRDGRYVAGVCGALGRATNTDPVLWRVILPVLTLIGGLGVILYILGVLLIPSEGDTGSPLEALAGRGRSTTPRIVTVILTVIVVAIMVGGLSKFGAGLLITAAVVGVVALLAVTRVNTTGSRQFNWPSVQRSDTGFSVNWPQPGQAAGTYPGRAAGPQPGTTSHMTAPTTMSPTGWPTSPTASMASADQAESAAPIDPMTDTIPSGSSEPTAYESPAYQAPFAPHGPFEPASPYSYEFPGLAPTDVLAPQPAPRVKPRSPMRRITISAVLVVVGFLGILDATNALAVPAPMYFAAALATVGLGMFLGSFAGRVRGPITLGVLLVVGLMISATVDSLPRPFDSHHVTITPASVADIAPSYSNNYGDLTLDLSHLKFTNADMKAVDLRMKFGQLTVVLPPNVDVTVAAHVKAGDIDVMGREHSGLGAGTHTAVDYGADGPGGGTLHIDASMTAGDVEIRR